MLLRVSDVLEQTADDVDPAGRQIDDLLAAAGIARSTFYLHFRDKAELLDALGEHVFGEFLDVAGFWWALEAPVTRPDVREAMERLCDAYRVRRGTVSAVVDAAANDTGLRDRYRRLVHEVVGALEAAIVAGQLTGTIDASLDARGTATWIAWMIERGMTQLVMPADANATDRLLQTLTDLVWNALYAPA